MMCWTRRGLETFYPIGGRTKAARPRPPHCGRRARHPGRTAHSTLAPLSTLDSRRLGTGSGFLPSLSMRVCAARRLTWVLAWDRLGSEPGSGWSSRLSPVPSSQNAQNSLLKTHKKEIGLSLKRTRYKF